MILLEIEKRIYSLQDLVSGGIIEPSEGKEKIFMLKEEAVKKVHDRAICQRSSGRYVTKVKGNDGLSQKTADTYNELIEKLYEHYYGISNATLETLYPLWIDYRRNECSVKEKTIKEDGFMWNVLLKGQEITQKPLKKLLPNDYIRFFRSITKGRQMTRKRFNNMKSVMNGILYYAIEREIIFHNPLLDINYQQFSFKAEDNEIIPYTESERREILNYLDNDNLYSLAIKLFFHLTLRIGELKGLRFDDISGEFIHICRFVNDKNIVEDDIKGHASSGKRWLPLPKDALKIIECIRNINPDSDYMFFMDGKPITTGTFNRHLKRCCTALSIEYRSSHKLRFSTASIMYKNGVTAPELQGMLGHTTLAMTTHYLRNVTSREETLNKVNCIFC